MRKRLAMCLAVMLLLAACAPQEPPEPSTSQAPPSTTEPTQPPTTEPPAEAEKIDWYASELEYTLSYEDLTTKDLPYSGGHWMVSGETGVAAFSVWANGGSLGIIDLGKGNDPIHTIPLPEEMQEVETTTLPRMHLPRKSPGRRYPTGRVSRSPRCLSPRKH